MEKKIMFSQLRTFGADTCKLSYYLIRCVFAVSTRQRYRYTAPYTTHWLCEIIGRPLTVVSATRHSKIITLPITNSPIRKMWTRRRGRRRSSAGTVRPTFICTHQRIIMCLESHARTINKQSTEEENRSSPQIFFSFECGILVPITTQSFIYMCRRWYVSVAWLTR